MLQNAEMLREQILFDQLFVWMSVFLRSWGKRLTTAMPEQVPDGATVALVPRNNKHHLHDSHDYMPGESKSQIHRNTSKKNITT